MDFCWSTSQVSVNVVCNGFGFNDSISGTKLLVYREDQGGTFLQLLGYSEALASEKS